MSNQILLILPFGLIPLYFLVTYVFFKVAEDAVQDEVGGRLRHGITEFPTFISLCLYGTNENKMEFTPDGKSIVLTVAGTTMDLTTPAKVKDFIKNTLTHCGEDVSENLVDELIIEDIVANARANTCQLTFTLPDEVVLSESYIESEIRNIGRVFKRNSSGDETRWLLYPQGMRDIEKKDGRLYVHIDRVQLVPGFFDEKKILMSEKQITRNIRNRLWNRIDVRCISLDRKTYVGEILGL